jgi:hypothetical protein
MPDKTSRTNTSANRTATKQSVNEGLHSRMGTSVRSGDGQMSATGRKDQFAASGSSCWPGIVAEWLNRPRALPLSGDTTN